MPATTCDDTRANDGRSGQSWKAVRLLVRRFEPIHAGIGIFGNVAFFVGSVFFLYESLKVAGTWLFIVGSFGMLVGSVGRAFVRVESRKIERQVSGGREPGAR